MLTKSDIDDILKLVDSSDFQELKLEIGDLKLEFRKGGAPPPVIVPAEPPANSAHPIPAPALAAGAGIAVPAPLLGIFWHAPRPGADPFVRPGDKVKAETIIGIIEVMKLMNTVPAGIAGVVLEISAPNGEMVEYGQCLIRVQPEPA